VCGGGPIKGTGGKRNDTLLGLKFQRVNHTDDESTELANDDVLDDMDATNNDAIFQTPV